MMSHRFTCLVLVFNTIFFLAGCKGEEQVAASAPNQVKQQELVGHKALYDVSLTATHSGSQVVNISGQMYYELSKSCDAWSTSHRFFLNYDYADAPTMRRTSDFSTYELFDGSSFSFSSRRENDGEIFEEIRGYAGKDADGNLTVEHSMPDKVNATYKGDIQFPMMHTRNVLNAMAEGKTFFNATIFDGSDMEGPVQVNAFLGGGVKKGDYTAPDSIKAHNLLSVPARHLRLAFFNGDSSENESAGADYEMDMIFHENGVIQHMDVDYTDFSIAQNLVALEELDDQCAENPNSSE